MEIINNEKITADKLPFDFNEANRYSFIDMDNRESYLCTGVLEKHETNFNEFIDEMNELFDYVYNHSND